MSKSASQWHVVETKVISLWHFERPVLGFASPLAKLCGIFSCGAPATCEKCDRSELIRGMFSLSRLSLCLTIL